MKTNFICIYIHTYTHRERRHAVAQLVEALRYKPEGRVFEFGWCHWDPSGHIMALGSISDCKRNEYQGYNLGVKAAAM